MPGRRRQKKRPLSAGLLTNDDEGVLYTMKVAKRPPSNQLRNRRIFRRGSSIISSDALTTEDATGESVADASPPQSSAVQPMQYTISKKRIDHSSCFSRFCHSFGVTLPSPDDARAHIYKPSKPVAKYVNWTFQASFSAVFLSFLFIFFILCLGFACILVLAGIHRPECIVVSSEPFGANPSSKFADAFALSWTTFTTVGYGNIYTATGNDLDTTQPESCSGIIFLCTLESFLGLIYAGMGAAILFGKVNRIESHAHLTFANSVCLQYAEVDSDFVDEDSSDSDCESVGSGIEEEGDEETQTNGRPSVTRGSKLKTRMPRKSFMEKYKGCPVLTFQVVNDLCNQEGGEIIDGLMKVVGIQHKKCGGKISHTQLVRVNLVDFENPFFSQVWHGTHVLDGSSPLLTQAARNAIRDNGGSWPNKWFHRVDKIQRKLNFQNLIVTVAGVSNLSACSVYSYKWYKREDVVFGFDFAPLLYESEQTGKLEVDLGLVNDVREQRQGSGEQLVGPSSDSARSLDTARGGTSTIFRHSVNI